MDMTTSSGKQCAGVVILAGIAACSSPQKPVYSAPDVPRSQLAKVSLDSIARLLEVDGARVVTLSDEAGGGRKHGLYVTPTCHELLVTYQAEYATGRKQFQRFSKGRAASSGGESAEGHINTYSTKEPIRFVFGAQLSHQYWVTGTFTGNEFVPRLIETNSAGEATAKILPGGHCE